jgi:hypothetical protein
VQDDSPLRSRELRNHFEHFDSRVIEFIREHPREDWVEAHIGPPRELGDLAPHVMRCFDPGTDTFWFRDIPFRLQPLIEALRNVRAMAEDAALLDGGVTSKDDADSPRRVTAPLSVQVVACGAAPTTRTGVAARSTARARRAFGASRTAGSESNDATITYTSPPLGSKPNVAPLAAPSSVWRVCLRRQAQAGRLPLWQPQRPVACVCVSRKRRWRVGRRTPRTESPSMGGGAKSSCSRSSTSHRCPCGFRCRRHRTRLSRAISTAKQERFGRGRQREWADGRRRMVGLLRASDHATPQGRDAAKRTLGPRAASAISSPTIDVVKPSFACCVGPGPGV